MESIDLLWDRCSTIYSAVLAQDDPSIIPNVEAFIDTPQELFPPTRSNNFLAASPERFIYRWQNKTILIYADGACLNNGQANPTAGCAFVFRSEGPCAAGSTTGVVSFRLEEEGPTGIPHAQTSNRAELRAVIAALEYRPWRGEGWRRLVIATDSEYVAVSVTERVHVWARRGWCTSSNKAVKNRDLWEMLLQQIRCLKTCGVDVQFWRIGKELNQEADSAAKEAARKQSQRKFTPIRGVGV